MKLIGLIFLSILLTTCSKSGPNSTLGQGNSNSSSTTLPVSRGDGGSASGASCTGTISDAENDKTASQTENSPILAPIFIHRVSLSGPNRDGTIVPVWTPGAPPQAPTEFANAIPSLEHGMTEFSTDGGYWVRVKVLPQYEPSPGVKHCYDRALHQTATRREHHYTKLRFQVWAHAYVRDDNNNIQKYGISQHITTIDPPVKVNECSPIIKVPSLNVPGINDPTRVATFLEIKEVKSDTDYLITGDKHYAPAERSPRQADCWNMIIQVATDRTEFFKGYKRSDF